MPRPIFDITQYELRGTTPEVYSNKQRKLLNDTLSRVNGQIDWTGQLLGFSGPNYWGRPNPKSDGSYNWKGLPETMNEKRAMQVGAFGIYNKNQPYEAWPAPFNRADIRASGDAYFHIFEQDGKTIIAPLESSSGITYMSDPCVFVGGEYLFDDEVEFVTPSNDTNDVIFWSPVFAADQIETRMRVKRYTDNAILVRRKGSEAKYAFLEVINWQDISDWKSKEIQNQFTGIWGNKGNQLSFDHAFDSLDLHGYSESFALTLQDVSRSITVDELLARIGLEPTIWTPYANKEFGIKIGGCDTVYPLPPFDPSESGFEYLSQDFTFFECDADCNYELKLIQTLDAEAVKGIGSIKFEYTALADCGKIDFPCVEWLYDPTLDNGTYPQVYDYYTNLGPWATANDGEYDETPTPIPGAYQGEIACRGGSWLGFDDGEYDELIEPDCDLPASIDDTCDVDGGYLGFNGPPNYDDCNCAYECCYIDGLIYVADNVYSGPEIADGGVYTLFDACTTYDNLEYDRDPLQFECELDNGTLEGPVAIDVADEYLYDRTFIGCSPCSSTDDDPVVPCPLDPVRVELATIFSGLQWELKPTVRNSLVPLRLWKNHALITVDTVPPAGLDFHNFLQADENRGAEPVDSYRHFVRLPLEYIRNGKDWNRAEAVCNNQTYFSSPEELSKVQDTPAQPRPYVYSETYFRNDIPDYAIYYEEDYLVSQNRVDLKEDQAGFEGSEITYEEPDDILYDYAVILEYDPVESRVPDLNGEWKGAYYGNGLVAGKTGYLQDDLDVQKLIPVLQSEYPVYDYSSLKLPNVDFPDQPSYAALKNYVVSYAYFCSDFSASDDPVFDPDVKYCWRNSTIDCKTVNDADECIDTILESNTAYLLHPTT